MTAEMEDDTDFLRNILCRIQVSDDHGGKYSFSCPCNARTEQILKFTIFPLVIFLVLKEPVPCTFSDCWCNIFQLVVGLTPQKPLADMVKL